MQRRGLHVLRVLVITKTSRVYTTSSVAAIPILLKHAANTTPEHTQLVWQLRSWGGVSPFDGAAAWLSP